MDITINRTNKAWDGIFGQIPELKLVTLEHAYHNGSGAFDAKVPQGRYKCVRGEHVLANRDKLETFEVTNVPGHTGILFHPGNKYQDSIGCILPGMEITQEGLQRAVTQSRIAWQLLMDTQKGVNDFMLTINDPVTHNLIRRITQ